MAVKKSAVGTKMVDEAINHRRLLCASDHIGSQGTEQEQQDDSKAESEFMGNFHSNKPVSHDFSPEISRGAALFWDSAPFGPPRNICRTSAFSYRLKTQEEDCLCHIIWLDTVGSSFSFVICLFWQVSFSFDTIFGKRANTWHQKGRICSKSLVYCLAHTILSLTFSSPIAIISVPTDIKEKKRW